jgi:hypothetical protein
VARPDYVLHDRLSRVTAEPSVGAAVTTVPRAKLARHVAPQVILFGEAAPALATVRGLVAADMRVVKVAVTVVAAVMVTVQGAVPEQAPLQPANLAKDAGVAVRVTTVPLA